MSMLSKQVKPFPSLYTVCPVRTFYVGRGSFLPENIGRKAVAVQSCPIHRKMHPDLYPLFQKNREMWVHLAKITHICTHFFKKFRKCGYIRRLLTKTRTQRRRSKASAPLIVVLPRRHSAFNSAQIWQIFFVHDF